MTSRIRAARSAFPAYRYPQRDLTRAFAALTAAGGLRPGQRVLLERLHANAGVDTRHTVLPIGEYTELAMLPGQARRANDRYIGEATALGERALRSALDAAGLAAPTLDLLIVTSVTGVAVPSLDALLIPRLGLRPDIKRLPMFGLGCVAGAAALGRLHDYLLAGPGKTAALLAVELCSLNWPRTAVTTADMVASGLFGDGAAALIASGGQDVPGPPGAARLPEVIASRSEVYPDSADTLGWRLSADGFRIVLTTELAAVVERGLTDSVTGFLAGHDLTVDDIAQLDLPPRRPQGDRRGAAGAEAAGQRGGGQPPLAGRGRQHVLGVGTAHPGDDQRLANGRRPGSFGLMIGLGPGVSAELVLLRW